MDAITINNWSSLEFNCKPNSLIASVFFFSASSNSRTLTSIVATWNAFDVASLIVSHIILEYSISFFCKYLIKKYPNVTILTADAVIKLANDTEVLDVMDELDEREEIITLEDAIKLFDNRVLKHIHDGTFYHKSALKIGEKLHEEALLKLELLKNNNIYIKDL